MKKKIIIAMAAVAAAFTMASCSKEQLVESEGTPVVGNDVITAFTEGTLTKTSLSGDDTKGYDVVWSEGDQIKIGGNTFTLTEGATTTSGKFQGTLPTEDGEYTACYPATYNGTDWPIEQTYAEGNITGSPMTADVTVSGGKVSGPLSFKNAGGILRLTLKGTAKVGSIKVKADGLDEITLDCRSGVSLDADGTAFHIAMPEGEYSGVSISIWTPDFDYCTKKLKENKKLIIEPSKITPATFTAEFPSPTSTDPLNGVFSVSASKQVCFSKGNLRYTVGYDSGEWSFFDKQYKCGPLHEVDSKEISLFTWGYNATQSINPIGSASNNVSITSGDLSQAQDWGCTINDGNAWRTLTSAEWTYLFKGRIDADKKYGYGTIGNVPGLIILPDEFTDPMKYNGSGAFKPQSSTASRWTDNMYTLAGNWEAMEAAGAVFLPAAGRRSGSTIATGSNEQGHYWSSSAVDSDKAYFVYFNYNSFDPAYSWRRDNGCSVRLVTDLYTVTFDMNGKIGTTPESFTKIKHGSTITKPSDPNAVNYDFKGWYKDTACTKAWDFSSDVVTENTVLYAKWTESSSPYKAVPAKFTVNAEGKQVYFSAGNLYYNGSAFKFETNQYGFHGYNSGSNTWGLFGWSTSTTNYGMSTSRDDGSYSGDFVDWGNNIGDGNTWRTLTSAEWSYLLSTRTVNGGTGLDKSYSRYISYGGKRGLIIYPDNYSGSVITSETEYTDETFPKDCVFLPAAGLREGDGISYIGISGYYWTSTHWSNTRAGKLLFAGDVNNFGDSSYPRNYGCCVRLVTDVTK